MMNDLERLRVILDEMVHEQVAQLVKVMWRVRSAVSTAPPILGVFACLAVAESALLNSGLSISEPTYAFIRSFAVELAERLNDAGDHLDHTEVWKVVIAGAAPTSAVPPAERVHP